MWEASDKQEYAARTIRPKLNNKLDQYLETFPPVEQHPHKQEMVIIIVEDCAIVNLLIVIAKQMYSV